MVDMGFEPQVQAILVRYRPTLSPYPISLYPSYAISPSPYALIPIFLRPYSLRASFPSPPICYASTSGYPRRLSPCPMFLCSLSYLTMPFLYQPPHLPTPTLLSAYGHRLDAMPSSNMKPETDESEDGYSLAPFPLIL
eukprot:3389087-Rhodomonas_salina.1